MLTELQILTTLGLAAAALFAVLPILRQRQFRTLAAGVSGSCLMGIGAAGFALVAGGFVDSPALVSHATAQELPADADADDSSAKGSGAAELPGSKPAESASATTGSEFDIEAPVKYVEPAGRPTWVKARPKTTGPGIHTVPVASGPFPLTLERDAQRALDSAIVESTNDYIAQQLGSQLAPQLLRYSAHEIKERFIRHENVHADEANYSFGPMHESFALLEFDQSFRDELSGRWDGIRSTSRLTQLGLFAGAGLLLLVSIFGYFRLDNATRGYYTGRLQFATAAAILAVIGAGVFAAQWIHWL
jgi:hypothetical protein